MGYWFGHDRSNVQNLRCVSSIGAKRRPLASPLTKNFCDFSITNFASFGDIYFFDDLNRVALTHAVRLLLPMVQTKVSMPKIVKTTRYVGKETFWEPRRGRFVLAFGVHLTSLEPSVCSSSYILGYFLVNGVRLSIECHPNEVDEVRGATQWKRHNECRSREGKLTSANVYHWIFGQPRPVSRSNL